MMELNNHMLLIQKERLKMYKLMLIVETTRFKIENLEINPSDAIDLIFETKKKVLRIFPEKEYTFDLIYGARYLRILREKKKIFLTPRRG